MKEYTNVYVAPELSRKYEILGWRYEMVRNGKYMGGAGGFKSPEEAREAGYKRRNDG